MRSPTDEARRSVRAGDVLYYHGPGGTAYAPVVCHGQHGVTLDIGGTHTPVRWEHVLGHRERVSYPVRIVDQGEDGAIVEDDGGEQTFIEGLAAPEPDTEPEPAPTAWDTVMTKALFFFKAQGIKNRPGLHLEAETDRGGHQVHRWKRSGDAKGAKPGQGVTFQGEHGKPVQGEVTAAGQHGVTVRDERGGQHQVKHGDYRPDTSSENQKKPSASAALVPCDREAFPDHIRALKLPPAWTDVKVSQDPDADLLAVGKDAKGRAQYVYSARFRTEQDEAKFERVRLLRQEYHGIIKEIERDRKSDDPKRQSIADCMFLVAKMGIRPGSDDDTGADTKAFGATNLTADHVQVDDESNVRLVFTGKKGVALNLPVPHKDIAKMLIERKKKGGRLFDINEKSLLDYAHSLDGGHFKTKDFRTHVGTAVALELASRQSPAKDDKEYKKIVQNIAKRVSLVLGNTPAVALKSYIDPAAFLELKP